MTIANHSPRFLQSTRCFDLIDICWPVNAPSCAEGIGVDASTLDVHDDASLALTIHMIDEDRAGVKAVLRAGGHEAVILQMAKMPCRVSENGRLFQIDVQDEGRRVIALAIDQDGNAVYCQSDLFSEAGLAGGTYDAPVLTLRRRDCDCDRAAPDAGAA